MGEPSTSAPRFDGTMLKFLTHKLRTHSLNEDPNHQQDKVGYVAMPHGRLLFFYALFMCGLVWPAGTAFFLLASLSKNLLTLFLSLVLFEKWGRESLISMNALSVLLRVKVARGMCSRIFLPTFFSLSHAISSKN